MRIKLLCATMVAALALSGCQSAEEPQGDELSQADLIELSPDDLIELSPDDLIEALTAMIDEIEGLYAEEITLLEELWALEVEYGTPAARSGFDNFRFRFYPRYLPLTFPFPGGFHSAEYVRERRATRIAEYREQLTEFDLTQPRIFIPSGLSGARDRIPGLENTISRALAEIEFDETGRRPGQ